MDTTTRVFLVYLLVLAGLALWSRRRESFGTRPLLDDDAIHRIIEDGEIWVEEDEPPQPAHPGTDYVVISVRDGASDFASLFRFDPEDERGFPLVARWRFTDDGPVDVDAKG